MVKKDQMLCLIVGDPGNPIQAWGAENIVLYKVKLILVKSSNVWFKRYFKDLFPIMML